MALVSSSSATAVAALPSNGLAGARTSFLGAAGKAAASRTSFAVRAAAPERPIWFPGSTPPPWLDGSLPGDFGFDPWGLGSDPESLRWNVQAELVHCRWAMLGAAGIFIPELLTKIGILNTPSWYTAGEQEYFTDTTTLFIVELILIGWAEGRRWADIIKPGCVNTDPIFPNNKLTGTDVGYPGGLWFDPLGYGTGSPEKLKELRQHRPHLPQVICLMMRKTLPLMNYVKSHPEIVSQLVDLIGITSIMEVLIRLIGADETMYSSYSDSMQWLDDIQVLEMIVDKFSSSDSAEVHANAAEILCAVTRYAPPALATKISSPSFVGRLFHHAFEDSRPKSVLVHSLSVCISLLDPKRLVSASYQAFRSQLSHGTLVTASPETVNGMLDSLGDLLKLLDVSSAENILPTTYGSLHPPLGKHRLKIVEFISVLLSIGSEVAEMRLINLGAIKHVIDLFFEYPFNNFLHHHVENIIVSCLESKEDHLIGHVLEECKLVTRILEAEKNSALSIELTKRTLSSEGRTPPRVGFVGHITRIANKLIQLANINSAIHSHLQQNSGWAEWHASTLTKRNTVENVYQWACGRPTSMQDRGRDSDDEDFRDRDYDVAALASNLSQAFKYGIYPSEDVDEAQASQERDDEDVYFDDEAAEVVINSLRLGDDPDSGSLFTNSNWFAFDEDKALNDGPEASPSANLELPSPNVDDDDMDEVILGDPIEDTKGSDSLLATSDADLSEGSGQTVLSNGPVDKLENDIRPSTPDVTESPTECVEWTEEDAEPGEVSENTTVLSSDIRSEKVTDAEPREVSGNTAVLSSEVGSEKVMDATDGVMPGKGQVGAEQGSENFVESLAPDTTIEKTLPHSPDVNSTGHSEPAANVESPLGEEKQEKEESREK